jgi:hypothetical protein
LTVTPTVTTKPSPTPTMSTTVTPLPPTITPTPVLVFQAIQKDHICEPDAYPNIEVQIEGEKGEPLDGIDVWLIWDDGADRAVTGLKPALGAGTVDFLAEPDVTYGIAVGELGHLLITQLRLKECPEQDDSPSSLGSWYIVLRLTRVEDTQETNTSTGPN